MTAVSAPPSLSEGQHVVVRLEHIGALPATVEKSSAGMLTVVLAVKDDRVRRLKGTEVAVEATTGRGIQRFTGELRSDDDSVLTLAMAGDVERVQRRDWVRVSAALPVTVRGIGESVGGETTTVDVSGNGLLIADPFRLPLGLDVRVDIGLPDDEPPVRVLGRVVREAADGQKGIRIDSLGRAEEDRMIRFIRERERQMLRAARER